MSAEAYAKAGGAGRSERATASGPGGRLSRIGRLVGFVALALGVLTLLFAGHQLWVTDLLQERAQASLRHEFVASINARSSDLEANVSTVEEPTLPDATVVIQTSRRAGSDAAVTRDGASSTVMTELPASVTTELQVREPALDAKPAPEAILEPVEIVEEPPARGAPIAQLVIPKIGVDQIVVEGTDREQLEQGPGHYVGTALPGQDSGNVSFAAHRTTYGAPFSRLDELVVGDQIVVRLADRRELVYHVTDQFVVSPSRSDVVADQGDHRLTLTTCTPKGSATSRLIIVAHPAGPGGPGRRSVSQRAETGEVLPVPGIGSVSHRTETSEVLPVPGNRSVSHRTETSEVLPVPGNGSVSQRDDWASGAASRSVLAGESPSVSPGPVASPVAPWLPAVFWSAAFVLVLVLARWLHRRLTWWIGAAVATPAALVVLNSLFISVGRLLPPSF